MDKTNRFPFGISRVAVLVEHQGRLKFLLEVNPHSGVRKLIESGIREEHFDQRYPEDCAFASLKTAESSVYGRTGMHIDIVKSHRPRTRRDGVEVYQHIAFAHADELQVGGPSGNAWKVELRTLEALKKLDRKFPKAQESLVRAVENYVGDKRLRAGYPR